jgi:hypothetical protein
MILGLRIRPSRIALAPRSHEANHCARDPLRHTTTATTVIGLISEVSVFLSYLLEPLLAPQVFTEEVVADGG